MWTTGPASALQMNRYAVYLFKMQQLSAASISNYLSAVRTLHQIAGVTVPEQNSLQSKIIKGIRNRQKRPVWQAVAITPDMLRAISKIVDMSDVVEMVCWVAVLMGFHCLLRASNLVLRSKATFDRQKNLVRSDFRIHNNIMLVHIRWAKTLQYRERKLLIPVIPFTEHALSAVEWFHHMIQKIPAPDSAPAFSVPNKGKLEPLTYNQLARCLRKWAEKALLDPEKMTSHCLRRGGASWLDEKGVPEKVVQAIGDWRTLAFKKYIDQALRTCLNALVSFTSRN